MNAQTVRLGYGSEVIEFTLRRRKRRRSLSVLIQS